MQIMFEGRAMRNAISTRWIEQAETRRVLINAQLMPTVSAGHKETMRLFVAALSKRPQKNLTSILSACAGFSHGA